MTRGGRTPDHRDWCAICGATFSAWSLASLDGLLVCEGCRGGAGRRGRPAAGACRRTHERPVEPVDNPGENGLKACATLRVAGWSWPSFE